MGSKAFLGRPGKDHLNKSVMKDVHLVAACAALGIPLTKKQASKWRRQEGAAYKYAVGIKDQNIAVAESTTDDGKKTKSGSICNLPK